ncbi:hypothetical protein O6H91_05G066200 [Diphasiastrum complanatum]|uniref:Uncharacterized protein n=1 Tax=Diphasiastrum complanatum TaxID=34168 RepID=A0ACC2DPD0_DIPCM|nr:hypothetical protein O6H91_05G066200 [Diphasiastrum complanatum]
MAIKASPRRELESSKVASVSSPNRTKWAPLSGKHKSSPGIVFNVQSPSRNMTKWLDPDAFLVNGKNSTCLSPFNPAKKLRSEAASCSALSPLQNHNLNTELLPLGGSDGAKALPNCRNSTLREARGTIGEKSLGGSMPRNRFANENNAEGLLQRTKEAEGQRNPANSLLKRKRPPRLHIPADARCEDFGGGADRTPATIHTSGGPHYGVATRRGNRNDQLEDAHTILTDFMGDSEQAFFGVFDGHGGCHAAQFASTNLAENIKNEIHASSSQHKEAHLQMAVRAGYLSTDTAFLEKRACSGASCVTAMIRNSSLLVANAGDCRAVISQCGTAVALTEDHRLSREDERIRIESLGGYVDCYSGIWRLQGALAVSRGIGDLHMKQWVSAEPEIRTIEITTGFEILILASDGLWDKVTNQEAVDIAKAAVNPNLPSSTHGISISRTQVNDAHTDSGSTAPSVTPHLSLPINACIRLVEVAIERGSCDDITVMVIDLQQFIKSKAS